MPETERTMLDRLNRRYSKANGNGPRYSRAEHVKVTAGHDARRICDYMAIDLWTGGYGASRVGPMLHGHEVKVSRRDWLTELRDPEKAETFRVYCDYWWLVVSDKAIVKPGELPDGWGLMVASGESTRVVQAAPRLDALPMPRDLQGTLMRATAKTAAAIALQEAQVREYRYGEILGGTLYTYGPESDEADTFPTYEAAAAARIEETDVIVERTKAGAWSVVSRG